MSGDRFNSAGKWLYPIHEEKNGFGPSGGQGGLLRYVRFLAVGNSAGVELPSLERCWMRDAISAAVGFCFD